MVVGVAPQGSAQNENLGWCLGSFQALHLVHADHSKLLQRCTFPAFSWGWAGAKGSCSQAADSRVPTSHFGLG